MRLNAHEKRKGKKSACECDSEQKPIQESYSESEFEVGKEITIFRGSQKMFSKVSLLIGTIERITEKAILVNAYRGSVWFPKSALFIAKGPKDEIHCWIETWFPLSQVQNLQFWA